MDVLRRCLLLAAEYDLEIDVNWISTHENTLADMLSRFDVLKIADIVPQLVYPTSSLRDLGFTTYNKQVSVQQWPITSGGDWCRRLYATTLLPDHGFPFSAVLPTSGMRVTPASRQKQFG